MISPAVLIDITPQTTVLKRYRIKLYMGSKHITTVYVYASNAIEAGEQVQERPWYKALTIESIERVFD